jgi:hypothetical protein
LFRDSSLFQLHEKQDEDRPYPNRYWKLRSLCISQKRTSSWKRKTKQEHGHSSEYPEDQFAFPGHFRLTSRSAPDVLGVRTGIGAMLGRIEMEVNGLRKAKLETIGAFKSP